MLVLDSGAVSGLAATSAQALALLRELKAADLWPPSVPTVVLVESRQGDAGKDANSNRLLMSCLVVENMGLGTARRAAFLRRRARRGSVVDAIVVAMAEPVGTVLTGDRADIEALSAHSQGVSVVAL